MKKVCVILLFLVIICSPHPTIAHVQHYKHLKLIEFEIYRNDKLIGKHVFSFKMIGEKLSVESEINFEIKKLGLVLYNYHVKGTEIYKNNELIKFNSRTNQNSKEKYVNLKLENGEYIIDGSSYKGKAPLNYLLGTWWNHSIIKSEAQISAVSGRIIKQKVTFLGKEKIKCGDKICNALHFNFTSTGQNLEKDKKLDTDVWYDEETLNWIKASFNKKGYWEYKLIKIN